MSSAQKHPLYNILGGWLHDALMDGFEGTYEDLESAAETYTISALEDIDEAQADLVRDAMRWRKLMEGDRVRMLGRTFDSNHIGIEFWRSHYSQHPDPEFPQEDARFWFEWFADGKKHPAHEMLMELEACK